MNRWTALAACVALIAALALRVPNLSLRPLHNDEAVNATKSAELWEHGKYAYDPNEYHGPTLHYATAAVFALTGAKTADQIPDAALRIAPVIVGIGIILLLPLFGRARCPQRAANVNKPLEKPEPSSVPAGSDDPRGFGLRQSSAAFSPTALAWSALLLAVSPAFVFYSRYFIHEILLVFFTALALGAAHRYTQTQKPTWAAIFGAGIGLMFATKETFVLTVAAMAIAAIISPRGLGVRQSSAAFRSHAKHASIALAAAVLMWLLFFSSFFTNPAGLLDSVRTYLPWLKRAGGHSPHIHPWYFYFQRLAWFHPAKGPAWSEAFVLILALIGAVVAWKRKSAPPRFLVIFTIAITAAYTTISYKTPWCLLNFYFPMILLAGLGAASIVEAARTFHLRAGVAVALLAFTAQLGWQAWRANFVYAADRRNPYVYAQTSPGLVDLVTQVNGIAKIAPTGFDTVIKVIAPDGDYWPLPWYLRRFKNAGWYDELPSDPYVPIIVVAAKLDARLDEKSDKKWIMVGYSELRPEVNLELYVELELWKKYVATLPRERQ